MKINIKIRNYGVKIATIILLILNIILLFKYNKVHKKYTEKNQQNISLENYFFTSLKETRIKTDLNLPKKNNKLIIRFYKRGCAPCIKENLVRIKDQFSDKEWNNIWFMPNYKSKNLKISLSTVGLQDCKIYNRKDDVINISNLTNESFYYFVLDTNQNAHMIFFPDKHHPQITKKYMKFIKTRYFKEN